MAVCMTCWAIMENPLSCEDLSEDTLCAVDPKIDTKKIWKYKLKIDNKKELCGFAQKSLLKILISDTPIWSFTVIMINPKKSSLFTSKKKDKLHWHIFIRVELLFFFTLDSNQSVRNFTNIVYYVLYFSSWKHQHNSIIKPFWQKKRHYTWLWSYKH